MHPILLHLGNLTIRTYGAMVAVAFLVSLHLARWTAKSRRIGESFLLDLVAILILSGLLGARLFYILVNLSYFREHPMESFKIWEGGLIYYGGFVLAALVGIVYTRYKGYVAVDVADCLAPALVVGQAVGRWGCFFAGCCYGKPSAIPWSVHYTHPASLAPLGIELHPVQLYESVGCLLIGYFLWRMLSRRKDTHGEVFWLYVLLYGALRFVVEFYRGDDRGFIWGGLSPSQMISLGGIVVAGSLFLVRVTARHGAQH